MLLGDRVGSILVTIVGTGWDEGGNEGDDEGVYLGSAEGVLLGLIDGRPE